MQNSSNKTTISSDDSILQSKKTIAVNSSTRSKSHGRSTPDNYFSINSETLSKEINLDDSLNQDLSDEVIPMAKSLEDKIFLTSEKKKKPSVKKIYQEDDTMLQEKARTRFNSATKYQGLNPIERILASMANIMEIEAACVAVSFDIERCKFFAAANGMPKFRSEALTEIQSLPQYRDRHLDFSDKEKSDQTCKEFPEVKELINNKINEISNNNLQELSQLMSQILKEMWFKPDLSATVENLTEYWQKIKDQTPADDKKQVKQLDVWKKKLFGNQRDQYEAYKGMKKITKDSRLVRLKNKISLLKNILVKNRALHDKFEQAIINGIEILPLQRCDLFESVKSAQYTDGDIHAEMLLLEDVIIDTIEKNKGGLEEFKEKLKSKLSTWSIGISKKGCLCCSSAAAYLEEAINFEKKLSITDTLNETIFANSHGNNVIDAWGNVFARITQRYSETEIGEFFANLSENLSEMLILDKGQQKTLNEIKKQRKKRDQERQEEEIIATIWQASESKMAYTSSEPEIPESEEITAKKGKRQRNKMREEEYKKEKPVKRSKHQKRRDLSISSYQTASSTPQKDKENDGFAAMVRKQESSYNIPKQL